ncbi:alpha-ketoglutarate-dependent dioxygenase AlkB [Rhodophyticola sp. CCM32]|uniref:alpha-ketoglutarate-dependent dioxygenase AlkB family protein n=1 Tax=Rhodophyticola sp. CCM32 TaxID=2916397 RepID=UPI00107F220C|nr:alpha-ketoglutarate-dependent dioxygenase AlkB [Rhodophyticola sp. CCM32]QBY02046.1 alpha-ketoglutarate-dependent dioxygenase AlkB [Rhodophyticola sp. CCM32]
MAPELTLRGVKIYPGLLDETAQAALVEDLRAILRIAPLFQPETPYGKPMSVRMSAAGRFGWFSDRKGYRYIDRHPSGVGWPAIPAPVLAIWDRVSGVARAPDCCLINFYGAGARMGLHQDKDEQDFSMPVVSVSLGDDALFRVGNLTRGGKTESVWLSSGDVAVLGGEARLVYHGVDRTRPAPWGRYGRCPAVPPGERMMRGGSEFRSIAFRLYIEAVERLSRLSQRQRKAFQQ